MLIVVIFMSCIKIAYRGNFYKLPKKMSSAGKTIKYHFASKVLLTMS